MTKCKKAPIEMGTQNKDGVDYNWLPSGTVPTPSKPTMFLSGAVPRSTLVSGYLLSGTVPIPSKPTMSRYWLVSRTKGT